MSPKSNNHLELFAEVLSLLSHPAWMPPILTAIYVWGLQDVQFHLTPSFGFSIAMNSIVPVSVYLISSDKMYGIMVFEQKHRTKILMISIACYVVYLFELRLFHLVISPQEELFHMHLLLFILLLLSAGLTNVYKLSLHCASIGAFLVFCVKWYSFGGLFIFSLIVMIWVAWARWYLKVHTMGELFVGTAVGIAFPIFMMWII